MTIETTIKSIVGFLADNLESPGLIEVFAADKQLKAYSDSKLKQFADSKNWDFSVDYVATYRLANSEEYFVFVNVAKNSLGLTELGELHVHARLARPTFAIQLAPSGLSRDLYNLVLREEIRARLLDHADSPIFVYAGLVPEDAFSSEAFFPPLTFTGADSRFQ